VALFIARVRERAYRFLYGPRPAFFAPLSWILTLQVFAISAIWYISVSQVPLPSAGVMMACLTFVASRVVAAVYAVKDQS